MEVYEYCDADVTDPPTLDEIETVSSKSSDCVLFIDQSSAQRESVSVVEDIILASEYWAKDLMRGWPVVMESKAKQ